MRSKSGDERRWNLAACQVTDIGGDIDKKRLGD
jgi:hypothetical protein